MRTDTLANLFLEEIRDVRSVEQQFMEALSRISKGVSVQGLSQAITRILETTERYMARLDRISHEIEPARALERTAPRARGTLSSICPQLSSREVEVLQLIAEGYANKQIAAELGISIKTVEKHRQHMMAKLDLHDTAGVTRYAIAAGVVEAVA